MCVQKPCGPGSTVPGYQALEGPGVKLSLPSRVLPPAHPPQGSAIPAPAAVRTPGPAQEPSKSVLGLAQALNCPHTKVSLGKQTSICTGAGGSAHYVKWFLLTQNLTSPSVALQGPTPHDRRVTQCLGTQRAVVPGNPPTFSPAQLSVPPLYPKWLQFPITIPAFLQEGVPKIPHPHSHLLLLLHHGRHSRVHNKLLSGWRRQKAGGLCSISSEVWMGQSCLSPLPVLLHCTPFLIQILPVSF